jgi:hypothetical protein
MKLNSMNILNYKHKDRGPLKLTPFGWGMEHGVIYEDVKILRAKEGTSKEYLSKRFPGYLIRDEISLQGRAFGFTRNLWRPYIVNYEGNVELFSEGDYIEFVPSKLGIKILSKLTVDNFYEPIEKGNDRILPELIQNRLKINLEMIATGDGRFFLNHWDMIQGDDTVVEVKDGKLFLVTMPEDSEEPVAGKEITIYQYFNSVLAKFQNEAKLEL